MNNNKTYTAVDLKEMFDMDYQTANKRMKSPYAQVRWGVEYEELPDGSVKRVVPEEKLHLWENAPDYRGRPIFKQEK